MKNKLNYWALYFIFTVAVSFLLNGGVFPGHAGDNFIGRGKMGAIKLSGKNPAISIQSKHFVILHPHRKKSE
jgi:hypothetical protein